MREIAPAKINLALHVRGREPDGYHAIETVFAFAEHGDELLAEPSDALTLELGGPFAASLEAERDNLVLRAARRLRDRFGIAAGARMRLVKNLPVASGMGGGSADAAASLRLLSRLWEIDDADAVAGIAVGLGADVPACLLGRTARGEGRGDRLTPIDGARLAGMPVLLVAPLSPLSTADVFRCWDGIDRGALGDWRTGRNDLSSAAVGLVPEIAEMLERLGGADIARVSGSGAACFGLYPDLESRAAAAAGIRAARPDWWLCETRLRP